MTTNEKDFLHFLKTREFSPELVGRYDVPQNPWCKVQEIGQAAPGTTISVDNRAIGGFRGSFSGTTYEFRKTSNGDWEEIFGDYNTVSSSTLANMYVNSRGFKRRIR